MTKKACILLLLVCPALFAQQLTVTRLAGHDGGAGYTDGIGNAARFDYPKGVAVDPVSGNIYVAERGSHTIRRITPAGVVTTFAGLAGVDGTANGRGGAARFTQPDAVTVDMSGNVYVAANSQVRKISPAGVVSTLATVPAPQGIAADSEGNLYVTDLINDKILRITPSGIVSVYATAAQATPPFDDPRGIAVDGTGNVYFTDTSTLRRITPAGVITTIASSLPYPDGVAIHANGDVYVTGGSRIHRVTPGGTVTTFAGSVFQGSDDGTGAAASFRLPGGLGIQADGTLLVCDLGNHTIRKITTPGAVVSTFAGLAIVRGTVDGPANDARFFLPADTAVDSVGNIFVADQRVIRKITPSGDVTTFAGSASSNPASIDGTGTDARFTGVYGLAIDASDNIYVADQGNNNIRKITPDAVVTTIAGMAFAPGSDDGTGTAARFNQPSKIAIHPIDGDLYVTDYVNHTIRKVTPAGVVTTFAGTAGQQGDTDDTGSAARFRFPLGIAFDSGGTMYVTDYGNDTIRKITTPGAVVTTLAGTPGMWGWGDGTGAGAGFGSPSSIAFDGTSLYVTDNGTMIRNVTTGGVVTTVAGSFFNWAKVEGTGSLARLDQPAGISSDGNGNLYVAGREGAIISHARLPGIADIATASSTTPPVNTLVQLETDPDTATSWRWSIDRRPSGSVAELSSTSIRNPTLTPDVDDRFVLLLRAEGPGGVRFSTVHVTPSGCAPLASVVASVPSQNLCLSGTGATAGVAVSGGGTLAYQWGWRSVSGGAITPIGGATASSYALSGADFGSAGTKYLVVTVTPGCGAPLVSNQLLINVTAPPLPVEISASSGVFAGGPHNYASVNDAGAGVTYVWSIANGTINSGQGTRNIEYTAGAAGDVTLGIQAALNGCSTSDDAIVPIIVRATGAAMLYTTPPCRILDTRIGGPPVASNETRTVQIAGGCGIPSSAIAVAVNLTVVSPGGTGWLTAFPAGAALPGSSTLNYREFRTRANNAIIPLSAGGALNVYSFNHVAGATHVLIDVVGWFE